MDKRILFFLTLIHLSVFGNDGAYFASGNQLIPISETEVSVTKEILTLVRRIENDKDYIYVTVDYTFFNPGSDKIILVGFEAPSPSGDVDGYPKNGAHPYISNFDVKMNEKLLDFKTSIVNTENYYVNQKIDAKTEDEVIGDDFNTNEPDFYYVYHFNANFKSGINKIVHTYRFDMSGSVMDRYSFDYILTAANRWGNNQIDDFTLHIDMGPNENFNIHNTFFKNKDDWFIEDGRGLNYKDEYREGSMSKFITTTGGITFEKKNFKPEGELYIYSTANYIKENYDSFDYKYHDLPKRIYLKNDIKKTCTDVVNEESFKILRNLPFAIRGYIFKTKLIQDYYLSQSWYQPNPDYKANLETLSNEELEWLKIVKSKQKN
ncbi:YARHG domain-containing protein [Aquimarina algicola]|uniref:YARHG domain-containing protein n=1 Tax=Aquimarina algicola TaxID=2589995 RepID=A0A504JDJ2_9FLAO|nr:YARHG domain-containing protein [Aquimarina algicola]TPN84640.1 YARHG domain-containing protein [Aquimarina algicola]